ncbi:MAG: SDR family oxidoreductase [Alphaproteobacteria bacterium]|nr:SDR family oxidoreductase [Alphaproteobacteria bacterium]MBV9967472.1 SDR family oxidoreductase [Alphaproteobacteria bacterium]
MVRPLADKHVFVTGASRGIGAHAAMALVEAGAAVTLIARDGGRAAEVAASIAAQGGTAAALTCDVSDYAAAAQAVDEAQRRFGPLHALINNAGVIEPIARLADADPAAWARNIEINLVGAFNAIRAVLPGMMAAGGGTIVNLSSGAAERPLEGWGAYCAAKAGMAMLTRQIALETAGSNIRVFGFRPGTTDTDMQVAIRASGINPISRIPRESLVPVEHPARAIVYLCTPAAADLSGTEVSLGDPEFRIRIGLA